MTLAEILKDSAYKLTQFSDDKIAALQQKISIESSRDKPTPNGTDKVVEAYQFFEKNP